MCASSELTVIVECIIAYEGDDSWMQQARNGLASGSPLAVNWIFKQLEITRCSTLNDVFRKELLLATTVVRYPEFAEGVRALLIDKDRNPRWEYSSVEAVPDKLLQRFFEAPWPENPLRDL